MSRKENILLAILAIINFTNIMDFMIMMPLQEFLVPVFHISPKQFSYLVASYALSAFLSSLVASFIVDRFDRKHALAVAYTGFVAGTLACAFAPSYELLLCARVVAGLFGGLIGAQAMSIVGDTFPYERRGRAMGALMGAFALAAVAGVPIGLYLAAQYSWHVPFLMVGGIGLLVIPAIFLFIPNMTAHREVKNKVHPFDVYRSVLGSRNQQMGLLMMFTLMLSHFATIPFIAPYLEVNVGLTKNEIALMYCIGGFVSFFSSRIAGFIADKYGKHKVLTICLLLSAIPVFLITHMGRLTFYYVYLVTALFFMITSGRMVPAQALITSVVPPQMRGGFMNLNSSLQQLAAGLIALVSGSIVTKQEGGLYENYEIVGYISIALSVVCALVVQQVRAIDLGSVENVNKELKDTRPLDAEI